MSLAVSLRSCLAVLSQRSEKLEVMSVTERKEKSYHSGECHPELVEGSIEVFIWGLLIMSYSNESCSFASLLSFSPESKKA